LGWADQSQEPEALSSTQQTELVKWCELVDAHYVPAIAIAERRVLSAISDRPYSDEDALIDAVIAWENLFGHCFSDGVDLLGVFDGDRPRTYAPHGDSVRIA
jgi:hypothetical protein